MDVIHALILSLFTTLVFPGLIFIVSLAFFTEWYIRKLVARMQNRMGPAYVGPFGILQPLADFLKLFLAKEEKIQRYSMPMMAKIGLALSIGATIATLHMLPLSPVRFASPYDVLLLVYLYALWVSIGIIIAALSYPNPFTIAGTSRFIALALMIEPAWIAAILIPVFLVTNTVPQGYIMPYSILFTAMNSWRLWLNYYSIIPMVLGLCAIIVLTQAKTMLKPFDIPEAEQELIAGPLTEFSGPVLALYNLLHDIEIAFSAIIITYLFLGGPYPFKHLDPLGIVILLVKYLAVVFVLSVIRSSTGRLRIEQGISMVIKYGLVPAVLGLIIAIIIGIIV